MLIAVGLITFLLRTMELQARGVFFSHHIVQFRSQACDLLLDLFPFPHAVFDGIPL